MAIKNVLLLDGAGCVRDSIGAFLNVCGLRCIAVSSVKEAVEQCKAVKFEVVILEPKINHGLQVCSELKDVNSKTKVVALSTFVDDRVKVSLKTKWGFDEVLHKPCDMDELSDVLSKLLT